MMRIEDPCGFLVEPDRLFINSKRAAARASRVLGSDWFSRGYRIRPAPPLLTGSAKLQATEDLAFLTEAETFLSPDNAL